MRIYVAGEFEEREKVREVQRKLIAAGHSITHDWTQWNESDLESEELDDYRNRAAQADCVGVSSAQVLVLLPHPNGKGMYVELGLALSKNLPVLVMTDRDVIGDCVFYNLGNCTQVADVKSVIAMLSFAELCLERS